MGPEPWLDIRNGEAWLGDKPVLQDLNLRLNLGQSTTVLGPNGAGKSSLVKLIDRSLHPIVKPDAHIKLFGRHPVNLWQLRQRIGVVSSDLEGRCPGKATALEIVLSGFFGAMWLGRDQIPTEQQRHHALRLMQRLGLASIVTTPYAHLSDGQRRRLLIARALVHDPDVLVLDEPSRALDLRACHQLISCLQELCRNGTTVVQVTHRIETIVPEMNRVLFLQQGRISGDGSPTEMLTDERLSNLFNTPLTVVEAGGFRQVLPARLTSGAW